MHETVISGKIITKAKEHGNVKAVYIELGELAAISAEELEHSMGHLVDWTINIKTIPAIVQCDCGNIGEPDIAERGHDFVIYTCQRCGNVPKTVLSGKDITLKKVIVDNDGKPE